MGLAIVWRVAWRVECPSRSESLASRAPRVATRLVKHKFEVNLHLLAAPKYNLVAHVLQGEQHANTRTIMRA